MVTHTGDRLAVVGEVTVPRAVLELSRPPPEAIQPSRWELFVDGEPSDRLPPGFEVEARVRVILGDGVRVSGMGLDAGVRGSLLVIDEPDRPTRASGELQLVGGTFQAYGQDLIIEEGRLLFAGGSVTDPGLRVRAYRRARDGVRAGVEARGTLEAPEVTLWSEPPMAHGDALAYLLLGRPLEATSEGEADYLARAATSLGLRGGALLAERLGERWGFEEATIETGDTLQEASLMLGRFLTPRLYVGYGVGLFDPVSTFRIRYRLTERWTLQGESGKASSGDLLYTIESGDRGGSR
jgi:translocation and assembly module TamB